MLSFAILKNRTPQTNCAQERDRSGRVTALRARRRTLEWDHKEGLKSRAFGKELNSSLSLFSEVDDELTLKH